MESRLRGVVVERCGTGEQLISQLNLAFAFGEAGWQVPRALSCQAGPDWFVWFVSLPLSPMRRTPHFTFGGCAGLSCSGPHDPCLLAAFRPM